MLRTPFLRVKPPPVYHYGPQVEGAGAPLSAADLTAVEREVRSAVRATMPDETALKAAAELGEILEDIAGRPLTADERARCHQHTATVDAMFKAAIFERQDDDADTR